MTFLNIYSPLEQFYVIPIVKIPVLNFIITNELVIIFVFFSFFLILFYSMVKPSTQSFYVIPNRWQLALLYLYKFISYLISTNIGGAKGQKYLPFFFSLFLYVLFLNLIGLIPFSFTFTSHIIVTIALSFSFFIGINIFGFKIHGLKMFGLFFPSGTDIFTALLLVPIEIVSYIFRPISLSIRLFANMMAGHVLLKILAGFVWTFMHVAGFSFIIHFLPILIILPLFILELAVAIIQAFVFTLLTIVYLGDILHLH